MAAGRLHEEPPRRGAMERGIVLAKSALRAATSPASREEGLAHLQPPPVALRSPAMRILLALAISSVLTACTALGSPRDVVSRESSDWRTAATGDDRARLRDWRK